MIRFLLITLFVLPTMAAAMDIRFHNAHPEGCIATASGAIVAGDTDRLRAAMPGNPQTTLYTNQHLRLCLDSPGGSFVEGLAIARYLRETGISSHVPQQAKCLSACAIAFLGGTVMTFEDGIVVQQSRSIHGTARLAFHAPQLDVPDAQFDRDQVQHAFGIAMRTAGLIFSRLEELRISTAFALDFFAVEGDALYEIDRVGRVADLVVDVEALQRLPASLSDAALARLCARASENYRPATYRNPLSGRSFLSTGTYDLPREAGRSAERRAFVLGYSIEGFRQWNVCVIRWRNGSEGRYPPSATADIFPQPFVSETGDYDDPTPPPRAKIRRFIRNSRSEPVSLAPLLAMPETARLADISAPTPTGVPNYIARAFCAPLALSYRVFQVQNFATLRSAPNFDAPVLREISKSSVVSPFTHKQDGYYTRSERCIKACNHSARLRLTESDLFAPASCKRTNELWWHVQTDNGMRGWMSAKYLSSD